MFSFIYDVELSSIVRDEVVHLVNTQVQHEENMQGTWNDKESGKAVEIRTQLVCEVAKIIGRPANKD